MGDAHYFGDGLTYLNPSDLKGKLIAIEGTDGVGRSTHIELLQEWLEVQGYGVITTGWTRSNLMSKTIEVAKEGNTIDRWSLSLLYATDFADRTEHDIIPPMKAGAVVLADRYIYTAFARDAALLTAAGYRLDELWPVGQFRWSTHVELAAHFIR